MSDPEHLRRRSIRLHEAAAKGDLLDLRDALAVGADPNFETGEGYPALTMAAARQDGAQQAMVAALLAAGAAPDPGFKGGAHFAATPLSIACRHGELEVVRMLLGAGADPNRISSDGLPLCSAASSRDPALAELLIEHGASMDCAPGERLPPGVPHPIARAAIDARPDALKALLRLLPQGPPPAEIDPAYVLTRAVKAALDLAELEAWAGMKGFEEKDWEPDEKAKDEDENASRRAAPNEDFLPATFKEAVDCVKILALAGFPPVAGSSSDKFGMDRERSALAIALVGSLGSRLGAEVASAMLDNAVVDERLMDVARKLAAMAPPEVAALAKAALPSMEARSLRAQLAAAAPEPAARSHPLRV